MIVQPNHFTVRRRVAFVAVFLSFASAVFPASFTRLRPLPAPRIVASAKDYPGEGFRVAHLCDGLERTEYSSDGLGTNTFVEFDFGTPVALAGFKHLDRADPATVAESELVLQDASGNPVRRVVVTHPDQRSGTAFAAIPNPVKIQKVRWQVTRLGHNHYPTVGGAEVTFYAADPPEASPAGATLEAKLYPVLERAGAGMVQPLQVTVHYPYAEPSETSLQVAGEQPRTLALSFGTQTVELRVPANAAGAPQTLKMSLTVGGQPLAQAEVALKPVRPWEIYILPHSHVDIGYTELQTDVEQKQMRNLERGLALAQATAGNPEGSRYKWNVEVLWAVESYLRLQPPEKQHEFLEAVRRGQIGLDAMFGNELTGLCRPEELLRLFRYATQLGEQTGVPVEAAMISDVPGYTWGVVSAMAEAGVKYWSIGPNYSDRIGGTLVHWENKPFYWVGPSGQDRVLCWVPFQGYANSHKTPPDQKTRFLLNLVEELDRSHYPYDLIHLRWSGYGDNAVPDELIPPFVREWNEKYASPRLIIATTAEAFRAFERRYADQIPRVSGDWTPYWEDGAASSARETALNRGAAERLVQAETLFAMLSPAAYPLAAFQSAWRNVVLYDEHTWGAHNSVSQPDLPFVKDQWKIKQAFALDADRQSRLLLEQALAQRPASTPAKPALEVFNTTSWTRTDLVTVPPTLSQGGDRVVGPHGRPVPSQRLRSGELVFLAADVPALCGERYTVEPGARAPLEGATAQGSELRSRTLALQLDERSGTISSLLFQGRELAVASNGLNRYLYLPGSDLKNLQSVEKVRISVGEPGPLVASLLIEAEAPGCQKLVTEIRLIAGLDQVEINNLVDKKPIREKEGVHFGFAFQIPEGVMRLDIPFAVMRPELDQIPGSCKNWFTVSRWLDIANPEFGVTCAILDAPLIEVGAITANLLGSQTDPQAWIQHLAPSQTFYSWVMNNHWHTNYRAEQEGPTLFRYVLRPHKGYRADEAARFGIGRSQPLLVTADSGKGPKKPRFTVEGGLAVVSAFKPSDDGKAWIIRLFGASGKAERVKLAWADPKPSGLFQTDLGEKTHAAQVGPIEVPAWGLISLRAERAP